MRSLFRKKQRKVFPQSEREFQLQRRSLLSKAQRRWANGMTRRTGSIRSNQWKVILGLFVLLTGGYSISLILRSFLPKEKITVSISSVEMPRIIGEVTAGKSKKTFAITEKQYEPILRFRAFLDSLRQSPTGKVKYDSITHQRPGLMDSLDFIETHYQSHKHHTLWNRKKHPQK